MNRYNANIKLLCVTNLAILTAIDGNCRVSQGASVRVGTPTYSGSAQTTYNCVANDNCNYDVHVIANYESNGHHGFRIHNTGNTSVNLVVNGTSTKVLILVFVSYEPVRWSLSIPSGVVIDRVILVWKCERWSGVCFTKYTSE